MMEVIARFQAVGTIANYQNLPEGERALYDQFVLEKLQEEAKESGMSLVHEIAKGFGGMKK